jgi:hypothetical protein
MEIEAAILPVSLRAEKLCHQYAIRALAFAKQHPVRKAIQQQQQLRISTQLGELAERVQEQSNVEEISILLAKPWTKPASAYATFTISTSNKSETADLHKQWLQGLRDKVKAPILLLSDMRVIRESEGYWKAQEQLLGTLRTARDSRQIRQNTTKKNTHNHRNN